MSNNLISMDELAARTKLKKRQLRTLLAAGKIPGAEREDPTRPTSPWKIPLSGVEIFEQRRRGPGRPPAADRPGPLTDAEYSHVCGMLHNLYRKLDPFWKKLTNDRKEQTVTLGESIMKVDAMIEILQDLRSDLIAGVDSIPVETEPAGG